MTKAERDADIETLEEAKRAALRAFDRVFQNSGMQGLQIARGNIQVGFEFCIELYNNIPTEEE